MILGVEYFRKAQMQFAIDDFFLAMLLIIKHSHRLVNAATRRVVVHSMCLRRFQNVLELHFRISTRSELPIYDLHILLDEIL